MASQAHPERCAYPDCSEPATTGLALPGGPLWICAGHHLRLVANLLEPWVLPTGAGWSRLDVDALLEELAQEAGVAWDTGPADEEDAE